MVKENRGERIFFPSCPNFVSRPLFPVQDASEKETGTKVGSLLPDVSTCDQALNSSAMQRCGCVFRCSYVLTSNNQ